MAANEDRSIGEREFIAGFIKINISAEINPDELSRAVEMIDAIFTNNLLTAARHAAVTGCTRCGELVDSIVGAKNARDEKAYDDAINELHSHLSLEADIAGDLGWLEQ